MSTQKQYTYYNCSRNKELRDWCAQNRGRSSLIDDRVFGYNMISHYKNGGLNISDQNWNKIKSTMVEIEQEEKILKHPLKSSVKQNNQPNQSQVKSNINQAELILSFKKDIDDWLINDRKRKLRLADAIYSANYTKSFYKPFSEILRRLDNDYLNIKDSTINRIYKVMDKANSMIAENHPFAIAAFKG